MTSDTSARTIPYRPDVDALRTVAVGLVILHHAFPRLAPGGFVGVDVFFVISGFLITGILREERQRGTLSVWRFYGRRIRRIFPAAVFVLATALLLGWLLLFPDELASLGRHVFAAATFTQNFRLRDEIGYFDVEAIRKPLLHFWSLSVEEQFYLVWPLLLAPVALPRLGTRRGIALFASVSLVYAVVMRLRQPQAIYYDPMARVWQLAVGGWLAVAFGPEPPLGSSTWKRWLTTLATIALLGAGVAPVVAGPFPSVNAVLAVLGAVAWLLAAPSFRGVATMARVGKLSYGLYLWHWLLLSFGRLYVGQPLDAAETLLLLALAMPPMLLSYRYVEPIRFARWRGVSWVLLVAMGACAATGRWFWHKQGLPNRAHITRLWQTHLEQTTRTPHSDRACRTYVRSWLGHEGQFYYCRTSAELLSSQRPRLALIGDSHAHVLFPGFARAASLHSMDTVLLANTGCPPLPGFLWGDTTEKRQTCQTSIDEIYRIIATDPAIRIVLLATRGPMYIHGEVQDASTPDNVRRQFGVFKAPDRLNYATYAEGLSAAFQRLEGIPHVERSFYLLENPEMDFRPKDLLPRPFDLWGISLRKGWIPRTAFELRMRPYRELVHRVLARFPSVEILDPAEVLCDRDRCFAFRDGRFLYADDDHLSVYGSELLAVAFAPRLFRERVTSP